ncbi:hypothetical protein FSP39_000971 [Pinctada imbricata]|uniref:Carboxypeptidase n=1 Tax=Pinctada imbricata TaxID=66713 RepID=A0AA88Y475_PINIB|nr:hypothetical protein FSP39_000971 [Pinctada imbricata]
MRELLPLCLLVAVSAAPAEDEVILPLPGLSDQLPWKHYSGYLNGTGERKLHYWFIQSANPEPQYDPLVLWLNGGPGCSSMVGLLLEHGPFTLHNDGETLEMNPFSWNKVANMLYLEAPVGVGYSYTDQPIWIYTDSMVAMDNHKALTHFFIKFPELKGNEFFMAGESYGGFFVPTLSSLVLNDSSINFKGFAVGNGLLDWDWYDTSVLYFLYNHGAIIGEREWAEFHKECCMEGNYQRCNMNTSDACDRKDVLYWRELKASYPCVDTAFLERYMNNERVREALHIPDRLESWTTCRNLVYYLYQYQKRNVLEEFRLVVNSQKRVLVYNGDVDALVTYQANQWFIDDLGIMETRPYTAWGLKDEMGNFQNAGFWREYGNLRFVTIKGAGHKSPRDKPREALHVFNSFIKDIHFQ